jgi:hypothetical protein
MDPNSDILEEEMNCYLRGNIELDFHDFVGNWSMWNSSWTFNN